MLYLYYNISRFIISLILIGLLCSSSLCFSQSTPPAFQSSVTAVGASGPAVVNKPTGVATSDLMVVGIMFEKGSSETITPPAGWTLILRTNNSTDVGMATYYKVAQASEPISYSFGFAAGSKWAIGISRITNVDTSAPIDISSGLVGTTASGNVSAPSLTTTGPNRLVLCFYTNKKSSTFTPASTTTERYDAPNTAGGLPSNMMASFTQATTGATGNRTATSTDAERWAAQQIAITPAPTPLPEELIQSPLPVELIHFSAKKLANHTVALDWTTATELNNAYFAVERSENFLDFKEIGKITGAGSINTKQHYNFIDNSPLPGTSYYRLRQVDFDGAFEYSAVRAITLNRNPNVQMTLYPNPVSNKEVMVRLSGLSKNEKVLVEIMDLSGKRLFYHYLADPVITIPTKGLLGGTYLVRLTSKTASSTQKLIIR